MGNIFLGQKKVADAVAHYRRAIEGDNDQVEAYNNLAWIWATHPNRKFRKGSKAVEYAQRAVSLGKGQNPNLFGTLAAAYAETGQFGRAIGIIKKILSTPGVPSRGRVVELWRYQQQLYRKGQPYRDPSLQ